MIMDKLIWDGSLVCVKENMFVNIDDEQTYLKVDGNYIKIPSIKSEEISELIKSIKDKKEFNYLNKLFEQININFIRITEDQHCCYDGIQIYSDETKTTLAFTINNHRQVISHFRFDHSCCMNGAFICLKELSKLESKINFIKLCSNIEKYKSIINKD